MSGARQYVAVKPSIVGNFRPVAAAIGVTWAGGS